MMETNVLPSDRKTFIAGLKDKHNAHAKMARTHLSRFATFVDPKIKNEWFHRVVYEILDEWIDGKEKKVAIFMPPQHGKSTMSSITTPAMILGKKPDAKIAVCSYSDKLASKFNRGCQDIIDSENYKEIFPSTVLPAKGVEITNELRNNTYFETIKHKGFFKAVSVQGTLTGDALDYGIIDDPIKDRKQANSQTYRDNLWSWFNDVFLTRMHNDSRVLMLFTRWHQDDLAGRLFDPKNENYDEEEAKEWTIVCLQALKEDKTPFPTAKDVPDPRSLGEALWESKHSQFKHEKTKRTTPVTHASLNQQRPSPAEGNKIMREWFNIIRENELPFNPKNVKKDFWIDGAFTDKTENDESAQMACSMFGGNLYIFNCVGVRKELNEYLKFIRPWLKSMGYDGRSSVWIELKASGWGFYSMLKSREYGNHNCRKINSKTVAAGKMNRVENAQPTLASGKVFLVMGSWIPAFVDQCATFPNDLHDDMVDVLGYAIDEYFISSGTVEVSYS